MSHKYHPSLIGFLVTISLAPGTFARGFRTVSAYPTGEYPSAAAVQDFNNDHISDIATANVNDANVSVLLGNGDGTFGAAMTFSVGAGAVEVASADLNDDGNADLVVTDGIKSVYVVLGNGDGTFGAPAKIQLHNDPIGIEIADLNSDGKLDLAIAIHGPENNSSGEAAILLGAGNGTFVSPVYYPLSHNGIRLVATDLNADGKLDLAVAVQHFSNEKNGLAILLGNGDGTFQSATTSVAGNATDVAAGDFNGDGKIDLALAAQYSDVVRVLLGNGDGTFQPAINYDTQGTAVTVTVADLNHDGPLDLVVGSSHTVVLLGNGDGTFQAAGVYAIGQRFAAVGNFNRDRVPDLVAGAGFSSIGVAFGRGDGTFRAGLAYPVGDRVDGFGAADFNGDGNVDLAVGALQTTNGFVILFGDGEGGLVEDVHFGQIAPHFVRTGDFNGDNKADILFTSYDGFFIYVYLGNGDGTFSVLKSSSLPDSELWPAIGDFNHDGRLDVVATRFFSDKVTILLGLGDGTFQSAGDYPTGDGPQSPTVSDFNGDGNLDFAISNTFGGSVGIYLGNGDGTFQSAITTSSNNPIYSAAADFNRDGKADLVLASNSLQLFLGNGDGTFQAPQILFPDSGPISISDVDGDGKADVVASADFAQLVVLRGKGDGAFRPATEVATGSQFTGDSVLADLNGDGLPEAIVSNITDAVSVLLNTGPGPVSLFPPH